MGSSNSKEKTHEKPQNNYINPNQNASPSHLTNIYNNQTPTQKTPLNNNHQNTTPQIQNREQLPKKGPLGRQNTIQQAPRTNPFNPAANNSFDPTEKNNLTITEKFFESLKNEPNNQIDKLCIINYF